MSVDTYVKLEGFFKQMFFSLFAILAFSVFLIGVPVLSNSYSIERIDIDYAEIQITGKRGDPGLRIVEGRKVISGECYISLGDLCSKYHHKSLFGKNNKIIVLSDGYAIVLYSEMVDGNGNGFLIDNVGREKEVVERFIGRKRWIVGVLSALCVCSLIGFLVVKFFLLKKYSASSLD